MTDEMQATGTDGPTAVETADVAAFEAFRREKARKEKAEKALATADQAEREQFLAWQEEKAKAAEQKAVKIPRPRTLRVAPSVDDEPQEATPYDLIRDGRPYEIPRPYDMRSDGVWLVKYQWDRDAGAWAEVGRDQVATAPVLPTQVYYAPDGEELVEVAWWHAKYARVVSEVVSRSVASVGRSLVKQLRPRGFPVTDSDGPKIEKFLAVVEAANTVLIGSAQIARQVGWQPDGTFVTGQGTPRRVEPSFPTEQRAALASYHSRGTMEGWRGAVRHIEPYPVPRAALAASLAASLLNLVEGAFPFAFDIWGTSSGGKTTSAQLGYSAWGNPALNGGGITAWSSTRWAIQLRLALCNGVPVVLDESKNVRFEDIVKHVIYDLPMGEPGARGGDTYSARLTWDTVVISTGERSLLDFTGDAGAAARVLSAAGAPFGRSGEASERAALAVSEAIAQHYGHAGPAFAAKLTADKHEWISSRHAELAAEHRQGSDIARRRAPQVALLQLAEEIACRTKLLPYQAMPTQQWAELLGSNQAADDPAERALEVVRSFVSRHPHRMYSPASVADAPSAGWIGARRNEDGRDVVDLYPEPLSDELERQGYQVDAVKPFWIEKGWLTMDPKQPKWLVRRRPVRGEARLRVYEFPADVFDGGADD